MKLKTFFPQFSDNRIARFLCVSSTVPKVTQNLIPFWRWRSACYYWRGCGLGSQFGRFLKALAIRRWSCKCSPRSLKLNQVTAPSMADSGQSCQTKRTKLCPSSESRLSCIAFTFYTTTYGSCCSCSLSPASWLANIWIRIYGQNQHLAWMWTFQTHGIKLSWLYVSGLYLKEANQGSKLYRATLIFAWSLKLVSDHISFY